MKQLLTLSFILLTVCASAQFSSIDIIGGVQSSFRILSDHENQDFQSLINTRNNLEERKINATIGFNINYKINDWVSIKSGVRYTEIGYVSNHHGGNFRFCGVGEPLNFALRDFKNQYLEIPLVIRISESQKSDIIPFVEFGIAPSQLLFGDKNWQEEFNSLHLPMTLGVGAEYKFMNQLAFIQLVNKTALTRNGTDMKERVFEMGFEAGLRLDISNFKTLRKNCKSKCKQSVQNIKQINNPNLE